MAADDVHSVSVFCVGRDLDAFTHFHELAGIHSSSVVATAGRCVKVAASTRRIAIVVLVLFAAPLAASNEALLFQYAPTSAQAAAAGHEVVLSERVLRASSFDIPLADGRTRRADVICWRFESDGREVAELSIEGWPGIVTIRGEMVFASFWLGIKEGYHLLPLGEHHVLVRAERPDRMECELVMRLPSLVGRQPLFLRWLATRATAPETSAKSSKRRSVGHPSPAEEVITILMAYGKAHLTGNTREFVEASQAHAVDLMNLALMNSKMPWKKLQLVGTVELEHPVEPNGKTLLRWLAEPANTTVTNLRKSTGAKIVVLSTRGTSSAAYRSYPEETDPRNWFAVVNAVIGSDNYFVVALHEMTHVIGGDHNPENETVPAAEDPHPDARGFYSCGPNGFTDPVSSITRCSPTVPWFPFISNPDITINGVRAGVVGKQDNARTVSELFRVIARWNLPN